MVFRTPRFYRKNVQEASFRRQISMNCEFKSVFQSLCITAIHSPYLLDISDLLRHLGGSSRWDGLNRGTCRVCDFDIDFGRNYFCALLFAGALQKCTGHVELGGRPDGTSSGELVADPPRCGVAIRGADVGMRGSSNIFDQAATFQYDKKRELTILRC
jgi:hypothetical protein